VDIEWPPFQSENRMLDHPATEEDVADGRAAFVLRNDSGKLVGVPVLMGMPRLGFSTDGEQRRPGIAIQVEAAAGQIIVGVQHADGTVSICSAKEFEAAPRFLVFYRKPGFGINEVERALTEGRGRNLTRARRGNVVAVRWKQGPVLFIRHAVEVVVAQEVALLGNDNPFAEGLAACDALFEVSFLDLDEVLDESISLLDVQWTLADELGCGYEYLEWNGHLSAIGKG